MVFNVVARNHDDLCYSYSPSAKWTSRHQMSINGKQDDFTKEDLLYVGASMGINRPSEIIEMVVSVVSEWSVTDQDAGVQRPYIELIQQNMILL